MKKELIAHKDPKSPIAEIFRTLRTNIQFMSSQKVSKTLLITSTMPGEGKSWVSSNLAVTFAQAGKKVVIVDADMRKGRIHKVFQVNSIPGLSNFLYGISEEGMIEDKDIFKYIKQTEIENLYVIPAGNVPPNPSELLTSELTSKMIEKLKETFDMVILDGTPSMLVTDAVVLSRMVDSTLIVARYKETKKDNLQKLKKSIENVGGNIAGVVLNKMPINVKKYKSAYYYSSTHSKDKFFYNDNRLEKYDDINKRRSKEILKEIQENANKQD